MSPRDRGTYRKVAADVEARAPHPLVLIVALKRAQRRVGVYILDDERALDARLVETDPPWPGDAEV